MLLATSAAWPQQTAALKPETDPFYPKFTLCWQLYQAHKLDEAAAAFREVLDQATAAGDRLAQGWAHSALGRILDDQAKYPAARAQHEQALALFEALNDPLDVAHEQGALGVIAVLMGRAEEGRAHYRIALAMYRDMKLLQSEAAMMGNLSMAGDPDRDKLDEEEISIARQLGDKGLEAETLHRVGDGLFNSGHFDAAEEKYEQAAELYRSAGAKRSLARVLTSEGRLARAHGYPKKSIELYRQALQLQRETGDREGEIQTTNAMAVAYGFLNDTAHSLELYQQALSLARQTGSERIVRFEESNLATALIEDGRYREAAEILEKTAPRDEDYPDERYNSLAAAYMNLGRDREAEEALTKSVALARARDHIEFLPEPLIMKARVEWKLRQQAQAIDDAQECLRTIENLRSRLVPSDFMKRGFAERTTDAFDFTVRILSEARRPERALEVSEEARSRAFLDLLATRDSKPPGAPAPEPEYAGALASTPGTDAGRELRSSMAVSSMPLETLRSTALRLNSTILSYWVSRDATYIWVVPVAGEIHSARVAIGAATLKRKIRAIWPEGVAAPQSQPAPKPIVVAAREPRPPGPRLYLRGGGAIAVDTSSQHSWRELYDALIRPVEKWLPAQPGSLLTVVPHGPLMLLPFAALQDTGGRYLIERFTLHYIPAISLLQFTADNRHAAGAPAYLLVADPANTPAGPNGKPLPALPGARREIDSIARMMGPGRVTILQGKDANESRVIQAARGTTVVHLATHGIVLDGRPLDSFLALARGDTGASQDGHFTVQKVYNLQLHADLVFLSACRSGLGQISGDGIDGLTRAFLYAGTPSVIASLWDIADETAYRLVTGFYRAWLGGSDKAHALRSAQLSLLQGLRAGRIKVHTAGSDFVLPEDPVFWASFVLEGEPH